MPSYAGPPVAARPGEVASALRLLAYLALASTLIVLDHRSHWLEQTRTQASQLTQPVWWLAGLPGRLGTRFQEEAATRSGLLEENRELRNELLLANARLARSQAAAADNERLRGLLGVASSQGIDVQLAPILDIDLDPVRQRLVLAAGSRDGVRAGQAVIDAGGLMGQVIDTTPMHATVLLLTDPDHAVPVMVSRNGVRLIVYGRGDRLEASDIPMNSDVREGDVVVTSGLGGRFPAGFPVGTITSLQSDETRTFLIGSLDPAAQLDRGRDVLLLRSLPQPVVVPEPDVSEQGAPEAGTAPTPVPAAGAATATPSPEASPEPVP